MRSFLKRWFVTTIGVLIAAQLVHGITFTPTGLILATLLLGLLNAIVRPIMVVVSLPLVLVSFGLFLLVINALLLYWVGHILKEFQVAHFSDAFWGSLIISLISLVLNALMKPDRPARRRSAPPPQPPPPNRDDGKGPIIDV